MAAKMPMMATTIINSIRVKPFCSFVISKAPSSGSSVRCDCSQAHDAHASDGELCKRCAKRFALCQLRSRARVEAVPDGNGRAPFDILRPSAYRRQTNKGHKLT